MIQLQVWLRPPVGAPRPAGELIVAEPDRRHGGQLHGEFRYLREYLDWSGAFALDPLHLPLERRSFAAARPHSGIHGVFEDSLPDAWGRRILCRRHGLRAAQARPANLLALLGTEALGALAYTRDPHWRDEPPRVQAAELSELADAALRFEDAPPDAELDDLMRLFQAASSPGGARPKVVIEDEGVGWLVKFPSSRDRYDMVRLEVASLGLAEAAGIEVPEHRLVDLQGRSALMVRRFDQTPDGGRNHVISLQTLLAAEGYYTAGYTDLADVLRQVSDLPERDLPLLYRQMVFNAALGNTDDHLKNFAMLHGADGWRLSPAYDLLPDVNERREHVLHFGTAGLLPTATAMDALASAFGIASGTASDIQQQVLDACSAWQDRFRVAKVPEADISRLSGSIDQRMIRLKA